MNEFDELIDRLTQRLGVDRELQFEIARELRTHLQESAAEFQAAGMNREDARAAAAKALGDENDIAEQLWQANRRRMRIRKTVKWAAGLTLVPTAVAAAIILAWSAIASMAPFLHFLGLPAGLTREIGAHFYDSAYSKIPAAARALGITAANAESPAIPNTGDPKLWTQYCTDILRDLWARDPRHVEASKLQQIISAIDRGKQIDPDNAFYPLLKSGILMVEATAPATGNEDFDFAPDFSDSPNLQRHWHWFRDPVIDRGMLDQGLNELHEAAGKPLLTSYAAEAIARATNLLPPPNSMTDEFVRRNMMNLIPLPFARNMYDLAISAAGGQALSEASQGNVDRAMRIISDERAVAILATKGAQVFGEVARATQMYQSTFAQEAFVFKQLGQNDKFEKVLVEIQHNESLFAEMQMQSGLVRDNYMHAAYIDFEVPGEITNEKNLTPGREVEYAAFDRSALAMLVLGLTGAAAILAIRAAIIVFRSRNRRAFLFIGWRRLAKIILLGVILPVIIYYAYASFVPFSQRGVSAWQSIQRLSVEYAVVTCVMAILLRSLTSSALRNRSRELGLEVIQPGRKRLVMIGIGVLLGCGVVEYQTAWNILPPGGQGFALAGAIIIYALVWVMAPIRVGNTLTSGSVINSLRHWLGFAIRVTVLASIIWAAAVQLFNGAGFDLGSIGGSLAVAVLLLNLPKFRHLRLPTFATIGNAPFNFAISTAPIPLIAAIVLAILFGLPLRLAERNAVIQMEKAGASDPQMRFDQSLYHQLQKKLIES